MIPALGMVILPQNPSTEDGHVPGWSCILSVVMLRIDGSAGGRPSVPGLQPLWSRLETHGWSGKNPFCGAFRPQAAHVHPETWRREAPSC